MFFLYISHNQINKIYFYDCSVLLFSSYIVIVFVVEWIKMKYEIHVCVIYIVFKIVITSNVNTIVIDYIKY